MGRALRKDVALIKIASKTALAMAAVAALTIGVSPSAGASRANRSARFPFGVWENAKHTVRVKVEPCGERACGRVVWASAEAKADAERGGTPDLIGVQLFQGLEPDDPQTWRGKIFVPDLNGVFDGTVRAQGPAQLIAEGCMAKLLCKAQTWTRVGR